MEEYKIPSWADDYKESAKVIQKITIQIDTITNQIGKQEVDWEQATVLFKNIIRVLNYWTGHTFVGVEKKTVLEKELHEYFSALLKFVLKLRETDKPVFQECAGLILYRGMVYRYLGYSDPIDCDRRIEPIYNNTYVSWSKEQRNPQIENKLYGTMTWIAAKIDEPYYGIDLEGLEKAIPRLIGLKCNITKPDEHEVVFPTIKECITEIRYIEEDEEDEQT